MKYFLDRHTEKKKNNIRVGTGLNSQNIITIALLLLICDVYSRNPVFVN